MTVHVLINIARQCNIKTFRKFPRLVMFGRRRQLSASSLSASILHVGFRYATFLGIICFGIEGNRTNDCAPMVAHNRFWYKWFCLLTRLLICVIYGYLSLDYIFSLDNAHLIILSWIRLVCCLICAFVTLTMQFWFGQQVLRVVNSYLRLFGKVNALPGSQEGGFGGRRELSLLIFKMICLVNEVFCEIPELFDGLSMRLFVTILCDLYVTTNATMIGHLCFVGYLSVGALYARVNHYVQHELRRQLQGLEQPNGCKVGRRQLKAAGCRLDQCLAIYDDIQRVGSAFHRLMELPLCLILLFAFLSMTLVSYFIMLQRFRNVALWLLVARLFFDVVLLTLAIHGASSSSRVVRRLSLDNSYVTERNDWHMKVSLKLFVGQTYGSFLH